MCGERQPAGDREVKPAWLPPGLDDGCTQRRAARGLRPRPQYAQGITRSHEHHLGRRQAEFLQAGRMQAAGLGLRGIVPDPEDGSAVSRQKGQCRREACGRRGIGNARGKHLVKRGLGKAATQRVIDQRAPE